VLPSLTDIFFIIVLIVPGFVSLILLRWIAIFETKLPDLYLVIGSLLLSLIIYGVFGWVSGTTSFDSIRDKILIPQNLITILGVSVLIGIVPGFAIRRFYRGGIVRGDAWQISMKEASDKGSWVIVYTVDGREYKGTLHYSGGKDFPKEVTIRKPKQIFRDSNGYLLEEVPIGKEMLFSEKDISRIAFYEEV
jgi:hypothetical protein